MTNETDITSKILALYAEGPALLETALKGLTESDLDLAPASDAWSIRQIVHHLADGDDIWKTCIKIALGNSEALFSLQWYWQKSQIEWSENWNYASRSLESSLALLRANRRHIMDLLDHSPGALEKSVRLQRPNKPEIRIMVFDVLEIQAGHIVDHIKDIQAIRHEHGV